MEGVKARVPVHVDLEKQDRACHYISELLNA